MFKKQNLRSDFCFQALLKSKSQFATAYGGGERDRTDGLLRARQALSQLSYTPKSGGMVGLGGLEPPTSRLSGVRSNQLSYRPIQESEDRGQKTEHLLAKGDSSADCIRLRLCAFWFVHPLTYKEQKKTSPTRSTAKGRGE